MAALQEESAGNWDFSGRSRKAEKPPTLQLSLIHISRKKIDKLVEFAKGYGAKGLAYIAIAEDGSRKSSFSKFMKEEEMDALVQAMEGKPGDLLLFAADKNKVVYDVLGALRVELAKQMELLDKNEYRFVWVTEFPLLEWSEEENRFTAMHHPFTMPMEEDLPCLLYTSRCV